MTNEQAYRKGYDDYWNAKYELPIDDELREHYLRGYRDAEFDISIGNY